ncbi:uncharacterized protein B0P05DRAFT_580186 [Gilbertella persicaria]|nr:uncharacterized protein B0P05DRAFT_580186 [Gilbertella persicaria]KAI8074351.1 hypothetical protein B0P05DRAFT_580186 [Gilbertella persicaria]
MLVTQFSWIFLFGIQQEDAVLRSFSELNHSRMYTNNIRQYQKDTLMFDNNSIMDIKGTPNYPMPPQTSYSATPTPEHVAIPMYLNRSSLQDTQQPSTIILSPHLEYLIPVTAIHNYHANKEDPNELSFTKGEVLYVQEKKGSWWQAKKANGTIGMIPSNYVTDHKPI